MELKALTAADIQSALRMNPYHSTKRTVAAAARTTDPRYTLDGQNIVVFAIIQPVRGTSSVALSERFHQNFRSASQWPQFEGKPVDIQFLFHGESSPAPAEELPAK